MGGEETKKEGELPCARRLYAITPLHSATAARKGGTIGAAHPRSLWGTVRSAITASAMCNGRRTRPAPSPALSKRNDLSMLEIIAKAPQAFIRKQGWASVSLERDLTLMDSTRSETLLGRTATQPTAEVANHGDRQTMVTGKPW